MNNVNSSPTLIIALEDKLTAEFIASFKYESNVFFEVSHFSSNGQDLLSDLLKYKPDFLLTDPITLASIAKNLIDFLQKNDLSTRVILYAKDSQVVRNCLGKSLLSIINIIYHGVSKKEFLLYLQLIFMRKGLILSNRSNDHLTDSFLGNMSVNDEEINLLSDREIDIWTLLLEAKSENEIANKLHISVFTVRKHKSNISLKLGIKNKRRLTSFAHDYIRFRNV
ncbi:response regulator transcription factor [Arcicella lustrica]|uniref:LuxR C-terminal-related transcriptional regulator n=1 Tax=Arcicella lustrica TaxID=2984196 RepID=A0ABU5SPE8_9BACT|nr:LuxR C-terminal-related transcriptional regulator [Arcicella sp. DC25W]MEA5429128.1 LuxR C-terminal-related transcriptional regulator [Arcicella sp. DC25W]